ncbi:MAG: DNA-3-methyladenine glycosylase family protein [Rhodothermales bacterium]
MNLPYDPDAAIEVITNADPAMNRLIEHVGPLTLELRAMDSPFQALMRAIIYQQLSGKAAATIHRRVLALFPGDEPPDPEDLVAVPEESLRGAGMSRAKVAAVKDLAAKTLDGTVPLKEQLVGMTDEEIIERLTAVRGIGPWTVEMLLIFHLGRPDVLPVTDLGVRKGFMLTYNLEDLPKPSELRTYGERWKPYRSVASWYLWRAVDQLAA